MKKPGKISVLLSDVDGTLLNAEKALTKRARAAVLGLREAGIRLALTSGRPPRGLGMLVDPLRLDTPIAAFNGGLFVRPDLSIIESRVLPLDVVSAAIELILGHGLDVWVYSGSDWLVRDETTVHVERETSTVQFRPKVVRTFDMVLSRVAKIVGVSDDHGKVETCAAEAQAAFAGRASASCSQPYYLDITHKDANKGAVVEFLSRSLSLPKMEFATIGDGPNDVSMFGQSGFSIAMGNAPAEVRSHAEVTTDSYMDDGFAKAIEKYILGTGP